ncbi:MAG TPA: nickel-dependent hydrogenase large subunit, partial [Acetobacteraceae bacterium]|nr:nickel-dependent hydrogenase large subunit [Acetobacteraceae bacterium]
GHWPHATPLAARVGPPGGRQEPPEFLSAGSDDLDQIPLGPVHGGIAAASHLRLTGRGATIVRLEARLGYTHKGTLTLMRGKSPRAAARFAARLSAEATVAHGIAFARATEAALHCEIPPRATALRDVMAELERITVHLGDLGAAAGAAGVAVVSARCAVHAEAIRHAADLAFGHRLMMDCVIPGGVAADVAPGGPEAIGRALDSLADGLPELQALHQAAPLAGYLAGIGVVMPAQVARFSAGGVIGRAAGRNLDGAGGGVTGDAAARAHIRLMDIAESIRLLRAHLNAVPEGTVSVPLPPDSGEGMGCSKAARGDIWHWLRLDHGQIASVFMRDPAWAQWPVLEAALAGQQAEELPLILASFGLTSSGVDL